MSLDALLASINAADLATDAETLRPGHRCTVSIPADSKHLLRGGMNIHIPVTFDDGVRWLARIRQTRFDPLCGEEMQIILTSEVETMKALRRMSALVPEAIMPLPPRARAENTDERLGYFFVELVPGIPCGAPLTSGNLTKSQIDTTIADFAKFQITISKAAFEAIGSVIPSAESNVSRVGPLYSIDICTRGGPFLGPFHSNRERYLTSINHVLRLIHMGVLYDDHPVPPYLFHLELRRLVSEYEEMEVEEAEFYINHADDKGDHIMVDINGHITGIIDWECAYTTTKAEAFSAPLGLVDLASFFNGSNALSPEEESLASAYDKLKRLDLAACVRGGKVYQRLACTVNGDPDIVMLNATRKAFLGEAAGDLPATMAAWCVAAKEEFKDDEGLRRLLEREHMAGRAVPEAFPFQVFRFDASTLHLVVHLNSMTQTESDALATRDLISRAEHLVQAHMAQYDPSHDWAHVDRVRKTALRIAATCRPQPDMLVVELVALFHDMAGMDRPVLCQQGIYYELTNDSRSQTVNEPRRYLLLPALNDIAAKYATSTTLDELLSPILTPSSTLFPIQIDLILQVIPAISYSTEKKLKAAVPTQWTKWHEHCLELHCVQDADRLDAIGAVGIMRCSAFSAVRGTVLVGEAKGEGKSAEGHFYEKLVKVKDWMKTEKGKTMAEKRQRTMLAFLEALDEERREWSA
ncbi:uncharacterized protein P7C73_g3197, partial [Tremellales sp. Uapishka_1]